MRCKAGMLGANYENGWDLATASYVQSSGSIYAQESVIHGLAFDTDGTRMYTSGSGSSASVNEWFLSSAWDISSKSYVQNFSVYDQDTSARGFSFNADGTRMYVLGDIGNDVNEYSLTAAWDISTASYEQNFSVASQDTAPRDIAFNLDGSRMYVLGLISDAVNEYALSTAWDISTASYVQNFSVSAQDTNPQSLFFKPDGTRMYVGGNDGQDVNEYKLSTAWDVSTASYVQNFYVGLRDNNPHGLFLKPDGTRMYVGGNETSTIYEYSLI